jgi:hypothetical protein
MKNTECGGQKRNKIEQKKLPVGPTQSAEKQLLLFCPNPNFKYAHLQSSCSFLRFSHGCKSTKLQRKCKAHTPRSLRHQMHGGPLLFEEPNSSLHTKPDDYNQQLRMDLDL